ncbi:sensor histidine kinase [Puerhibacterium puerhi]|uniref:sensor histidine kinase n=1 Tax=Puerhibacterium puerhi TaxID=2692623 RepID=UPI001358736B|nr:sensor histidine kinase [Puerhibacterium puerhi]
MLRRWGWLATLGTLGAASLAYVVVVRGFLDPGVGHALGWPLLGVLPMVVFGTWLLTVSASAEAVYVAVAGTGMAMETAYLTLVGLDPGAIHEPWFPWASAFGLAGESLGVTGMAVMLACYPDGRPERRWQQVAARCTWLCLLGVPLALLVLPAVAVPAHMDLGGSVPNTAAVPGLAWAVPAARVLANPYLPLAVGLAVFAARALGGPPEVRRRLRVLLAVTVVTVVSCTLWTSLPFHPLVALLVTVALLALPAAFVHGILRYGAFGVAPDERGPVGVRASNLLVAVLYAMVVGTPLVLLSDRLAAITVVLVTALLAVALLPARAAMQRWVARTVLGDRDRQLTMLNELGRLEEAGEPQELLARLAETVRAGVGAAWVRVRLAGPDGRAADVPHGEAGDAAGDPAVVHALRRGDEPVGAIEVGPRHHGEYSDAERALLATVVGPVTAAVANVRLTAQLAARLDELTASRERLVAAQDDERRRLERDVHDGVQQDVVALIAGLRLARNRLARGELAEAELAELQDLARGTLTDIRELAHGIHPPVLSDNGLVAAVESGAARFPVPLEVDADERVRAERFPEDVETTAYYVVREALANTAKHARATHAAVGLARYDGHLRVTISDDGCGMDDVVPADRGGLANIRDRVGALHGTVTVGLNRPSGTTVRVELPVLGGRDG